MSDPIVTAYLIGAAVTLLLFAVPHLRGAALDDHQTYAGLDYALLVAWFWPILILVVAWDFLRDSLRGRGTPASEVEIEAALSEENCADSCAEDDSSDR